jgi:hypothetical protein
MQSLERKYRSKSISNRYSKIQHGQLVERILKTGDAEGYGLNVFQAKIRT